MPEKIDILHHARELQVTAIRNDTNESFDRELLAVPKSNMGAYMILMQTPPLVLPWAVKMYAGSEEYFFNLVYPVALVNLKVDFVLNNLNRLLTACNANNRGLREVSIDKYSQIVPLSFNLAFKDKSDMLMDLVEESYLQGVDQLLNSVQGDIPLLRYRKDLLKIITTTEPSTINEEISYLKTKIPSVNLKLWYPRDDRFPQLAFMVDDIIYPLSHSM